MSYYTSVILLCWLGLGVLGVLVRENDRMAKSDKRMFYLTYALIAGSALAEWCGVQLNGREDVPAWLLVCVKAVDFILTPMAGGALMMQMRQEKQLRNLALGILAVNAAVQILSIFTGWMVIVDESHYYIHGRLYGLYMVVCFAIVALVIVGFILYGRSFRRQNRVSLYGIMVLVVMGIVMQEGISSANRTSYLALTLGAAMMFIHYSEFHAQKMDDTMTEQMLEIDTDSLTGLFSRHAYSEALKALNMAGAAPKDLAAFSIDINGLKQVNDTMGHEAGDEMIRGAAVCILNALGLGENCYRTGGDEFVVLTSMNREAAEEALRRLERETLLWRREKVMWLSVSAGYALAADHDGITAEALVRESDREMYKAKAAYYRESGKDRRAHREQK